MREIEQQFREELQELIDRYKVKLPVPSIMRVAQDVVHKTLSFREHSELHNITPITAEQLKQTTNTSNEVSNFIRTLAERMQANMDRANAEGKVLCANYKE